MKIIFIASECNPLAKVGGLADIIGSLPKALARLGLEARIIIPRYGIIDKVKFPQQKVAEGEIFFQDKLEKFEVFKTQLPNSLVEVFLIDHPFYSKGGVYLAADATPHGIDEITRFAFLSEASLEFLKDSKFTFDIIHCHDWHTAIIPDLIKVKYKNVDKLEKVATVLTIHNLGVKYQGICDPSILHTLDLDEDSLPQIREDLASGDINFLQQGILGAAILNTVSPQYAKEILTPEFGGELAGYLNQRKDRLFGILNGIDYEIFDPKKDPILVQNYDALTWRQGKVANKEALAKKLGLANDGKMLIGLVSRLDDQKGLDILLPAVPRILAMGVKIVTLGKGDPRFEEQLGDLCVEFEGAISCNLKFDPVLATQIYAGCDSFLMPSRFEPCGLGQMIAMRHGTIPIVRDVGGLHDTVEDGVTGFKFSQYTPEALIGAVKRTVSSHNDYRKSQGGRWPKMVGEAMRRDWSWSKSAKEYVKLYEKALQLKGGK
jgi:starch synthase